MRKPAAGRGLCPDGDSATRSALPRGAQESRMAQRCGLKQSVEFALPRGVSIRGKVTEEGSARPVAGALVAFMSHARQGANSGRDLNDSVTDADGSFELAAPPGAGYLAIQARSEDYVVAEIGNREFADGEPGGIPLYAHAFVACELKPDAKSPEIGVVLRRGAAVTGRIIGPDDEPVRDTWIIGRAALRPTPAAWRGWVGNYHGNATSGRFELHGLDPDHEIAVHFFEPKRKLGATARSLGKVSSRRADNHPARTLRHGCSTPSRFAPPGLLPASAPTALPGPCCR